MVTDEDVPAVVVPLPGGPTGGDVEVRLERRADAVRVTVLDRSAGRGIGLVETLAVDWGVTGAVDGWAKGLWFEVPADPARPPATDEGALYGDEWLALVADLQS